MGGGFQAAFRANLERRRHQRPFHAPRRHNAIAHSSGRLPLSEASYRLGHRHLLLLLLVWLGLVLVIDGLAFPRPASFPSARSSSILLGKNQHSYFMKVWKIFMAIKPQLFLLRCTVPVRQVIQIQKVRRCVEYTYIAVLRCWPGSDSFMKINIFENPLPCKHVNMYRYFNHSMDKFFFVIMTPVINSLNCIVVYTGF